MDKKNKNTSFFKKLAQEEIDNTPKIKNNFFGNKKNSDPTKIEVIQKTKTNFFSPLSENPIWIEKEVLRVSVLNSKKLAKDRIAEEKRLVVARIAEEKRQRLIAKDREKADKKEKIVRDNKERLVAREKEKKHIEELRYLEKKVKETKAIEKNNKKKGSRAALFCGSDIYEEKLNNLKKYGSTTRPLQYDKKRVERVIEIYKQIHGGDEIFVHMFNI
jgi:hypothetical protein